MQFLVPLYLLGALAVAIPIYLHLRRKPPQDTVAFSSLMFLRPTPHPPVKRRTKLDQLPLLLLRCLALLLLAAFFARPFLRGGDRELAAGEGRTVLVLDTSASMQRTGVWEAALAEAREVIRGMKPTDSLAILTASQDVRTVVGFDDWDKAARGQRKSITVSALETLAPGWQGTDLGTGLLAAAEHLADAAAGEDATTTGRIVVVSDLQSGASLSAVSDASWPAGLAVDLRPVETRATTNATLTVAPSPDPARPLVRVWNDEASEREEFTVQAGATNLSVVVPAGESRLVEIPEATATLVLSGDEQSFDNQLYLAPPQPTPLTLQFLGKGTPEDSNHPEYYFRRAFGPSAFLDPRFVDDLAQNPSVMAVARPLDDGEREALRGQLAGGARVLVVVTDPDMAETLTDLAGLDEPLVLEEAGGRYALLENIDFDHPALGGFQDPRWRDFTGVHFWKHRVLAADALPGARVVARFDNGDPAWLDVPVGPGNLMVMLAGWHPRDSQLALSSKFLPLLYSIFADRGPRVGEARQFFVGDPLPLEAGDRKLTLPDGSERVLEAGEKFLPDEPGLYEVAGQFRTRQFAVNLRRSESELTPMAKTSLEALGVPLAARSAVPGPETASSRRRLRDREAEASQDMWKWAALVLLGLLIIESLVTARTRAATPAMEGAPS